MNRSEPPYTSVLLIDADLDRRLAMHAFLETAGFRVRAATAFDEGVLVCAQWAPDVIVLGACADRAGAQSCLGRLREQSVAAALLWCVVPEGLEHCSTAELAALGADDCIRWPASRSELAWRVRAAASWKKAPFSERTDLLRFQVEELLRLQRQREQTLALLIHDMKNPLAGVISNVEYLCSVLDDSPAGDPELPSCAQDIVQASRRLYRMVQSLLDVSQSEDGLLPLDPRSIPVRGLLQDARVSCRARLRDRSIELTLRCPSEPMELVADYDMLLRLLANLIDNAIAATPNGGEIELSAELQPDAIVLGVHDQGRGMAADDRARLQQPAAPEQRKARVRRGLGLQACRVLAEAHAGTLTVHEHQPCGTSVCVRLPRS